VWVLGWDAAHARIAYDGGNGRLVYGLVSSSTAERLLQTSYQRPRQHYRFGRRVARMELWLARAPQRVLAAARPVRPRSAGREPRPAAPRRRGSRRGAATRAGPDDPDPPGEDSDHPGLSGRALELARELQAASDARVEGWRRAAVAGAKGEQLALDDEQEAGADGPR
jgi:hypothetical protein